MPFLKYFLVGSLIPVFVVFAIALYIEPLVGDLTRLANVSELSWGWNKLQPTVSIYPDEDEGDVQLLVIGDSFSEKTVWQSAFRDLTGITYITYRWEDFGSAECFEAGLNNLLKRLPHVTHVLLETIERNFVDRFATIQGKGVGCPVIVHSSVQSVVNQTKASRDKNLTDMPDALYTMRALLSEPKRYLSTSISSYGYISPLKRNDLFSNHRSDALLYFAGDLTKQDWTDSSIAQSVQNLDNLNVSIAELGFQLLIAVIPDKSTAYQEVLSDTPFLTKQVDIWQMLDNLALPSLSLKNAFLLDILLIKDFYLPNDTHLSTAGYIVLAREIAKFGFK